MLAKLQPFETAIVNRCHRLTAMLSKRRWHSNPFCNAPVGAKETYLELWKHAKEVFYPEVNALEKELGYKIPTEWLEHLALHTQITLKESAINYQHGRVLYSVLSDYIKNVATSSQLTILETGTARGFSSTCMAKAMQDHNGVGKIFTFDLLPHEKPIYWKSVDDFEGKKTRRELLSPWKEAVDNHVIFVEGDTRIRLTEFCPGRVHFAFLDGGHTFEHVSREFKLVARYQKSRDIVVFDDYSPNQFPGLVSSVDQLCVELGYDLQVVQANDKRGYAITRKI